MIASHSAFFNDIICILSEQTEIELTIRHITHFSIYVQDQDECLSWYQDKIGFVVCDDNSQLVVGARWLTISPVGNKATQFVLMQASSEKEIKRIGKNSMCMLNSDNCYSDCELFDVRGVEILQAPQIVPWGISAIFKDLYGNPYTLVELK